MAEPFQPTQIDLIPLTTLLAGATVTDDDLEAAIEDWEADPPDPAYELILRATVDDDTQT
jgi:hypothetical protein